MVLFHADRDLNRAAGTARVRIHDVRVAGALGPFTAQLLAKLDAGERLGAMPALDLRLALQHALPASSPAELLPPADALSSAPRSGLGCRHRVHVDFHHIHLHCASMGHLVPASCLW